MSKISIGNLLFLVLASMLLASPASGSFLTLEDKTKETQTVSMEFLGRGVFYTLNYEYLVSDSLWAGAGFGSTTLDKKYSPSGITAFPIFAQYYFNPGTHRVFATSGATYVWSKGLAMQGPRIRGTGLNGNIGMGYQFQTEAGFLLRATSYWMIGQIRGAWLGLTLGQVF